MLQRLISTSSIASAIAAATLASGALSDELRRISAPAPTATRNGGRRSTVAQDKRRARKQRATWRAKRLGHH